MRHARSRLLIPALGVLLGMLPGFVAAYVLPVDDAFRLSASVGPDGEAVFAWDVADAYYLYRQKFGFRSRTPGIELGEPEYPRGEPKHDEFFGDMEILRGRVAVRVPLQRAADSGDHLELDVAYQGCADEGICYPPQNRIVAVKLPPRKAAPAAVAPAATPSTLDGLARAFEALKSKQGIAELLPADQAFRLIAEARSTSTARVDWQIADGYYLYREKFRVAVAEAGPVRVGDISVPRGEPKHDEEFGAVEVFHHAVGFDVPLLHQGSARSVTLRVNFQGCADRGVCYPPMEKLVTLTLPASPAAASAAAGGSDSAAARRPPPAEHDRIAQALRTDSTLLTFLSFLGFGLLLAFTPCIFPMIPILSGIIVGQGHRISTGRAFALSLSYVLASALAYTVMGVLAGLFGSNLQALFQEPWIIASFSALFVLLAGAMFGFYQMQVPTFIQSRIAALSSKQPHGTLFGSAIMGALSALVVGPCVAAPLAGALIYIGQTGDAWLGGLALFALGFGMGIPLLIIGVSAGRLLPKAGLWMNAVRAGFGVGLLAVAVWLLARIVPPAVSMFMWALLLILPSIYLGAIDPLPPAASGWRKLFKGCGIVMLSYGVLMLIGVATGSDDPLQPLRGAVAQGPKPAAQPSIFQKIGDAAELDRRLAAARTEGKWVVLDFYADWCVSCQEMERYTFGDPEVRTALADMVLLQADVTANATEDQALMKRFGLFGPPATLFFSPERGERANMRIVGYMEKNDFLQHLARLPACVLEC